MKKFTILLSLFVMWCGMLIAGLLDTYKKGTIKLIPDSEFGKKTDWAAPMFHEIKSFTITEKGSIFAAVNGQHKICKFDPQGKLLIEFGQKGQGPGDTYHPSGLSIMGRKFLLVNEYGTNRKISLFRFDGKIHKVIKNSTPILNSFALNGKQIAILSNTFPRKFESSVISINIKNYLTGDSKTVIKKESRLRILKSSGSIITASDLMDNTVMVKTKDGNLLIGSNYDNQLQVFSPGGNKIRSIPLKITPTLVNDEIIARYERSSVHAIKHNFKKSARMVKQYKAASGKKKLFSKTLPLFNDIVIDSEGNILVFYFHFYNESNSPDFQVYSPAGDYICDCRIDMGDYFEPIDVLNFPENIKFHKNSLYCLVKKNADDDVEIQIIKVKL